MIYDLLFGRVDADHPLHDCLVQNGFSEDFAFFQEHRTEPDILGINYYPHMSTTEILTDSKRSSVWSGTEGIEELVRDFYARYGKPIFWTETSVPGTVEERLRWLEDSLGWSTACDRRVCRS